ncbi:MAG: thioredoxin family protein [Saprospiraceae bacterium]|nr:thioredoxin family protein [Saprospiraceae bacterium]
MDKTALLQKHFAEGMTYEEYLDLADRLLAEGKTSGTNHTEAMLGYTKMNMHRMHRIDKSLTVKEALKDLVAKIDRPLSVLIIAELWCGDVAQNIPIVHKILATNPKISIRLTWRDEDPRLIEHYLTDGGKSIPKVIVFDPSTMEELVVWGPRPLPAQEMVKAYKQQDPVTKEPYSEFVKKVQLWYGRDRYETTQAEWLPILEKLQQVSKPTS